jgi:hypothetical protein
VKLVMYNIQYYFARIAARWRTPTSKKGPGSI